MTPERRRDGWLQVMLDRADRGGFQMEDDQDDRRDDDAREGAEDERNEALDGALEEADGRLAAGDVAGAKAIAKRLLETAAEEPDVWLLAGAVAVHEDHAEEAIACYERAAALDDEYFDPWILMAEVHLELGNDPDRCVQACREARERAEDDDAMIAAVLLAAEALPFVERKEIVQAELEDLCSLGLDDVEVQTELGAVAFAVGDLERAERMWKAVIDREPAMADAHYGIGAVHRERGDRAAMIQSFLRVRALDVEESMGRGRSRDGGDPVQHLDHHHGEAHELSIAEDEMNALVQKVLSELPPRARELLENVPILVEDAPSEELVKEGVDPRLLGLFAGSPLPEKSHLGGSPSQPDAIWIFVRNLERTCTDDEDLRDEIRVTILHETAHYFGLEESDLAAIGLD